MHLFRLAQFSRFRIVGAPNARTFLILGVLLIADLFFIAMHVVADSQMAVWSLGIERSFAEIYGYLKAATVVCLLFALYLRRRTLTHLGWGLVFIFILLDDAFSLHETLGASVASQVALPTVLGFAGPHYAELILWALVGPPLLGIVALGYRREPEVRGFSRRFLLLLGGLFFCGGVVDLLHASANSFDQPFVTYVLKRTIILEDGGELIMLSLFFALGFEQFQKRPVPPY